MKVAVIGTGFGKHAAAPAYRTMGFDVEVVSPRDGDAVKRVLASDADLISVHSPPFMHLDHVTGAIEQGHAVLCDKPFGRNADEATEMRDRAARQVSCTSSTSSSAATNRGRRSNSWPTPEVSARPHI